MLRSKSLLGEESSTLLHKQPKLLLRIHVSEPSGTCTCKGTSVRLHLKSLPHDYAEHHNIKANSHIHNVAAVGRLLHLSTPWCGEPKGWGTVCGAPGGRGSGEEEGGLGKLPSTGMISTAAKDVCRRESELNGDSRTKRCVPFSEARYPYAYCPFTPISLDFIPALSPEGARHEHFEHFEHAWLNCS